MKRDIQPKNAASASMTAKRYSSHDSHTETFEWCKTCWLSDPEKTISNHGGECCTIKKKRAFGKLCDYWIRKKE